MLVYYEITCWESTQLWHFLPYLLPQLITELTSLEFEMAHKIVPKCLTLFKRQGKERAQDSIWPCYYVITSNTRPSSKKQGNQLITSGRERCRQSPPSVSCKIWPNTPSSTGVTCLWLHRDQRADCAVLPCPAWWPCLPPRASWMTKKLLGKDDN